MLIQGGWVCKFVFEIFDGSNCCALKVFSHYSRTICVHSMNPAVGQRLKHW